MKLFSDKCNFHAYTLTEEISKHSWEERNIWSQKKWMICITKKLINMLHWNELWIHNTWIKLSKCESRKLMEKILNNNNEWDKWRLIGVKAIQDPCIVPWADSYLTFLDFVSMCVNIISVRN